MVSGEPSFLFIAKISHSLSSPANYFTEACRAKHFSDPHNFRDLALDVFKNIDFFFVVEL